MPDNFSVIVNETVTIWSAIKIAMVVVAGLYLTIAATSWDKRALSGLILCLAMWLLTACSINEAPRTSQADALIAQSAANTQAQQAQAAAQQQAAQLAAQAQQQQATALQIAQANAVQAQGEAQAQQAAQNGLEAQENAAQAAVMSSAIVALDNANERAAERSTWLGWLLVLIVAGGLGVAGMWVYWRGRVAEARARPALPLRLSSGRSQLTDQQILAYARRAGYLVERRPDGICEVINPATNRLVSRQQLLLEVRG